MDKEKKQQAEKEMISYMISYYCKKKHHTKHRCEECEALLTYANKRIDVCPFMETKTFCSACKVHCYEKQKREQIRLIMRYAGPRMLWHRPIMALRHIIIEQKEKRRI